MSSKGMANPPVSSSVIDQTINVGDQRTTAFSKTAICIDRNNQWHLEALLISFSLINRTYSFRIPAGSGIWKHYLYVRLVHCLSEVWHILPSPPLSLIERMILGYVQSFNERKIWQKIEQKIFCAHNLLSLCHSYLSANWFRHHHWPSMLLFERIILRLFGQWHSDA